MINCINIEKKIKNKLLFKNFSLNMEQGDCILISGKSGCGKSTFLNLISLKDNDYEGTILYEGKDIRKLSIFEKQVFLNKKIGFVYQDYGLILNRSVKDNILLPYVYSKEKVSNEWYTKVVALLQIKERENDYVNILSGGEKQRVSIARALIMCPKLIIFDEPFSGLDKENQEKLVELLNEVIKISNTSMVIVSHVIPEELNRIITKMINLENYNESIKGSD